MSESTEFVGTAANLLELADIFGRYGTLIALIIGIAGWLVTFKDPQRAARFRSMAYGGGGGYIAILSVDAIYGVLTYILGAQFLPPGWPHGASLQAGHLADLLQLSIGLSGVLYNLGLACFIVGVTLWAFASHGTDMDSRGYRTTVMGVILIGGSIGGNLFGVIANVLIV